MMLQKYDPTWVNHFTDLARELGNALQGMDYRIEHVGSTAVPALAAKPIIDIDIIYFQQEDFETITCLLQGIGYYHNGNQGIEHRDVFKRKGNATTNILDQITHHLYVCPANSAALERHLLSRDFLRKNEWARLKYQAIKYQLAEQANQDRKVYAALKEQQVNPFIDQIIEQEKNERTI